MENKTTQLQKFWFLRILCGSSSRNKSMGMRIILFYTGLYFFGLVITLLDGSLFFSDDRIGYIEDIVNPFYMIALAISTYLVFSLVQKYRFTFWGNEDYFNKEGGLNLAIKHTIETENEYVAMVDKSSAPIYLKTKWSKQLYRGFLLLAFIVFLYASLYEPLLTCQIRGNWNFSYYPFRQDLASVQQFPLSFYFNQVKDFFVYVIIIPPLFWITLTTALSSISIVRRLQKDNLLQVVPSAPDNAGGLKLLGELSLFLFYIVIIQLLHIFPTSIIFNWPLSHQLIYPPYFLFAVFVFFSPLIVVRKTMRESKRKELDSAMKEFYSLNSALLKYDTFSKDDLSRIETISKLLEANKNRYKQSSSMAVWPYDFGTFIRFVTGTAIPIIIYVIQMILEKSNWLTELLKYFGI